MNKWVFLMVWILSFSVYANPNNYIGIDADGNVYELNHGASSGSLNINEGAHYETYSTSGTDIIYFDMATQAELDAIVLYGITTENAYDLAGNTQKIKAKVAEIEAAGGVAQ